VSVMTTADGRELHLLSVTSVVEHEDGSLEVNCSGQITHLQGEDARAFRLRADGAYRAQQEQQQQASEAGKTALELWREGALG
jgi:hypothetical protein